MEDNREVMFKFPAGTTERKLVYLIPAVGDQVFINQRLYVVSNVRHDYDEARLFIFLTNV